MRSLVFAASFSLALGLSSLASETEPSDSEVISPQIVPFTNAGMDRLPAGAPSRYVEGNTTPFQNPNVVNPSNTNSPYTNSPYTNSPNTNLPCTNSPYTNPPYTNPSYDNHSYTNPPFTNTQPNQLRSNAESSNNSSVSQLEYYMYQLVNQDRARFGAPPVKLDAGLCNFARDYAGRMLHEKFFGHVDPQGRNFETRAHDRGIYGLAHENIGWQSGDKSYSRTQLVELIQEHFMAEPPNQINHRYAILLPANQYVGVGIVVAKHKVMAVQEFTESDPFAPQPSDSGRFFLGH